jgi:hypothetical protein
MSQEAGQFLFAVNWASGPVTVELNVSGCEEAENEPEFGYSVELARWLSVPEVELAQQIARDLAAAEGQARLSVPIYPVTQSSLQSAFAPPFVTSTRDSKD